MLTLECLFQLRDLTGLEHLYMIVLMSPKHFLSNNKNDGDTDDIVAAPSTSSTTSGSSNCNISIIQTCSTYEPLFFCLIL